MAGSATGGTGLETGMIRESTANCFVQSLSILILRVSVSPGCRVCLLVMWVTIKRFIIVCRVVISEGVIVVPSAQPGPDSSSIIVTHYSISERRLFLPNKLSLGFQLSISSQSHLRCLARCSLCWLIRRRVSLCRARL